MNMRRNVGIFLFQILRDFDFNALPKSKIYIPICNFVVFYEIKKE